MQSNLTLLSTRSSIVHNSKIYNFFANKTFKNKILSEKIKNRSEMNFLKFKSENKNNNLKKVILIIMKSGTRLKN